MKKLRLSLWVTIITLSGSATFAAPVESVRSSRPAGHLQKVDAFFREQAVTDQLAALGLPPQEIHSRIAQLSETQLAAVAAEIDLLQAGGMIQGGNPHPGGPIGCILKPIGRFFYNVYNLIFCWGRFNID